MSIDASKIDSRPISSLDAFTVQKEAAVVHAKYLAKVLSKLGSTEVITDSSGNIQVVFEAKKNAIDDSSPEVRQAIGTLKTDEGRARRYDVYRIIDNGAVLINYDTSALMSEGGSMWWNSSEGSPNFHVSSVSVRYNNGIKQDITSTWNEKELTKLSNSVYEGNDREKKLKYTETAEFNYDGDFNRRRLETLMFRKENADGSLHLKVIELKREENGRVSEHGDLEITEMLKRADAEEFEMIRPTQTVTGVQRFTNPDTKAFMSQKYDFEGAAKTDTISAGATDDRINVRWIP